MPLAVINVADKAAADADYQLTPADIKAWERRHGALPKGCCVALNSGWDALVGSPKFIGKDDKGAFHFPGFHPETTDLLLKERNVAGIAVDTLSLDHGPSKDFKTHYAWLPAGRSKAGETLTVQSEWGERTGTVVEMPFVDPGKQIPVS